MTDTSNIATISNKPLPPIVVLRNRLFERRDELKAALTDIDPDHFIRSLVTAAQINPDLQACSFASLWLAVMRACRDGLLPDGKEGAIVPYKTSAQWIPMYQGLLKKFRQSGQYKWITASVVRAGEEFLHYVDETGEHFKHTPGDDDGQPITRVYAAALTKDGAFSVVVLNMAEIEKIKRMSRASREDAPWKVWPEEMMKKTALRRLSKFLPSGRDFVEDDMVLQNVADSPALTGPTPAGALTPEGERIARGAAAALDQFAGSTDALPRGSSPDTGETGGGGESVSSNADVADTSAAVPATDDAIAEAHERGKQAKTEGFSRKALPPEYRGEDRSHEAIAWQAGFDGKPMPEWKS